MRSPQGSVDQGAKYATIEDAAVLASFVKFGPPAWILVRSLTLSNDR
jgi:hypothetical protein